MIESKTLRRCIPLLVFLPVVSTGQKTQENVVSLKNWATPLYWQPNQTEREGGAQLKFSTNAVSTSALTFVAITPCRLVDTRGGAFNGITPFSGPSIAAMTTVTFPVQSAAEASADTAPAPCGTIPSIAQAYSLNLTVVPHAGGAVDYISMWPSGYAQPFVATLNDPQGAIVANAAIVPAGTVSGGISVYNQGPATMDVIIDMNGFFTAPTDLNSNTAVGNNSLANNTSGMYNTATGDGTLQSNTTGSYNTASGVYTLFENTTGGGNTGTGFEALANNMTGSDNTATGYQALLENSTGFANTATGYVALSSNTTGDYNTAAGYYALLKNTIGASNTASGSFALENNTTGGNDTAVGFVALETNTTGADNTAQGVGALENNTTGSNNTASGYAALQSNSTGSGNIAIGEGAAVNVSGGNGNNIHIGSTGVSGDSGVIKIGTVGVQTSAYIAGIYAGSPGSPNFLVCVDADGTLGTTGCSSTPSSRRFKEQISDMGDASSKLLQLRPVTFLYKPQYDDGSHTLQYGLIAEEVAKIYPDMVGYDKDGQPSSVKYQSLAPMLLNEVQKQAEQLRLQQEVNRKLEERLAALEAARQTTAAATATRQ